MAEAEAQPVGNDLATVEQQLTEHEVDSAGLLQRFCNYIAISSGGHEPP